jgi:hypothetical protein
MKTISMCSVALLATACVGTTGGDLFEFDAEARGPEGVAPAGPYEFVTGRGYQVSLEEARIHIGAVYLNRSRPSSVSSDTTCQLPGIYVAEVPGGADVDLLAGAPAAFSVKGFANVDRAVTAEVWLMGGDVNAESDGTVILHVKGEAARDGETHPFEGDLTIGANRLPEVPDPVQPGSKPICKQRVVSPIEVDLVASEGARLVVGIDPAGMFANVDFAELDGGRFRDDSEDQPSKNLYAGLRAAAGVYTFEWK